MITAQFVCGLNWNPKRNDNYHKFLWDFSDKTNYIAAINTCDFSFCNNIVNLDDALNTCCLCILNIAKNNLPNRLVLICQSDKPWFKKYLRTLLRGRHCRKGDSGQAIKRSRCPGMYSSTSWGLPANESAGKCHVTASFT